MPTGKELSVADFEAKLNEADERARFYREATIRNATTKRVELQKEVPKSKTARRSQRNLETGEPELVRE